MAVEFGLSEEQELLAGEVRRFAEESPANLVLADRDLDGARAVAQAVAPGVSGQCVPRQLDVGRDGANEALVADVENNVGPIDLFVANAGIATGVTLYEVARRRRR